MATAIDRRQSGAFVPRFNAAPRRVLLSAALLSLLVGFALLEAGIAEYSSSTHLARHRSAQDAGFFLRLPVAAQAAVSSAIGAAIPGYRVSSTAAGFQARSSAQQMHVLFGRAGVEIHSGGTDLGLSLQAIGYGGSSRRIGTVTPTARANLVTYAHPGLTEWYATGPLGLEQGFRIPRAPARAAAGPLTLSMALRGNAEAALAADRQSVVLRHAGASSLRYGAVVVTDADGRELRSWLALAVGRVLLRVDAHGARYPLRVDPFFMQGGVLTGTGERGEGKFGSSLALSADVNTALIGAPYDNQGVGAAWVFTRLGSKWRQQGSKLTGGGERGKAQFGSSVALAADGNTAVIGGPWDAKTEPEEPGGAVWVFTRASEVWTQQGMKLTGARFGFGYSVALSADGNTALVGGSFPESFCCYNGAVSVFARVGSVWSQQAQLTREGERCFGCELTLSGDGNVALISGPDLESASFLTREGSAWTPQGEEVHHVRGELALSFDGRTALIGGSVFIREGSSWVRSAELGGGWVSAALSGDGKTAVVGTSVFTREGSSWVKQADTLTIGGQEFAPLALSADGNTALVGDRFHNEGAARVLVNQPGSDPTVVTDAASPIGTASATLNATLTPGREAVTDCRFEYGVTESYGSSVPCTTLPGPGESPVTVSAPIARLREATAYHYRILATNALGSRYGTASYGADKTFTTAGTTHGVRAWGYDRFGQLGDGQSGSSLSADAPVAVRRLRGVTAVSAGGEHALALLSDGTVMAWGSDCLGDLGDGKNEDSSVPVPVSGLSGVIAISAGDCESLALLSNGTVMAWGNNASGELGDGSTADSNVPVPVSGLSHVIAVSANGHSMALLDNGTVMAWGENYRGQLGDGTTKNALVPVKVHGLTGAMAVSAGGGHSLALLSNGTMMSWGYNEEGQLGDGSRQDRHVPGPVKLLNRVTSISAGPRFSLAVLNNGTAMAWGDNSSGQLGDGEEGYEHSSLLPVAVGNLGGVSEISAGEEHSLARLDTGTVMAWGRNYWGQLGNGTRESSDVPVSAIGLGGVTSVSAGSNFSVANGAAPPPAPAVMRVAPDRGPASGGTTVNITGANFTKSAAVSFAAYQATSVRVNSPISLTAVSPPGTSGLADVTVTTAGGSSGVSSANQLFFYGPPTIAEVSPASGSTAGGTRVRVRGSGFATGGGGVFDFAGRSATSVNCASTTTCTLLTPANRAGTVNVTASVGGVRSAPPAGRFTYE